VAVGALLVVVWQVMYGMLVDLFESYDDARTCERQTVLKILLDYFREEYAVTSILNR
jgi:hypothetical protein